MEIAQAVLSHGKEGHVFIQHIVANTTAADVLVTQGTASAGMALTKVVCTKGLTIGVE